MPVDNGVLVQDLDDNLPHKTFAVNDEHAFEAIDTVLDKGAEVDDDDRTGGHASGCGAKDRTSMHDNVDQPPTNASAPLHASTAVLRSIPESETRNSTSSSSSIAKSTVFTSP